MEGKKIKGKGRNRFRSVFRRCGKKGKTGGDQELITRFKHPRLYNALKL